MSLMRDNRPRLAHFLPRRPKSGHSSSTSMHADVLQKRKQAAHRDTNRERRLQTTSWADSGTHFVRCQMKILVLLNVMRSAKSL